MNEGVFERKIKKLSGACYNLGLEKAKVRDMSGAVIFLRKSLRFDNENIDARNLLGLVYYEIGEVVDALAEWVISRNIQPTKNIASRYLKDVKENEARFQEIEMSLAKYNQALHLVRQESYDLAILQLNKVISHYPNMLRSHQLLALLYIQNESYAKAEKTLKKALSIDKTNTLCLNYMDELKSIAVRLKKKKKKKRGEPDFSNIEGLSGDDVIVPTYKESVGGWSTVGYLLIGLLIGIASTYFLVTPTIRKSLNTDYQASITSYGETIRAKEADIASLENEVKSLESQITDLEGNLEGVNADTDTIVAAYDGLIQVLNLYRTDDDLGAVEAFTVLEVNLDDIPSTTFRNIYNEIAADIAANAVDLFMQSGIEAFEDNDLELAIRYLVICAELDPEREDAIFYLARSYHMSGDKETADIYYAQYIEMNGARSSEAQEFMNEGWNPES